MQAILLVILLHAYFRPAVPTPSETQLVHNALIIAEACIVLAVLFWRPVCGTPLKTKRHRETPEEYCTRFTALVLGSFGVGFLVVAMLGE